MEKFFNFLQTYRVWVIGACVVIALSLHVYKSSLPCLTSDEVAFGYNSYSLSQTGRDEYGNRLPLRLKSFDDFKLPAMAYLSIPFIKLFGLNTQTTRAVVAIAAILTPILFYLIAVEFFKNRSIAIIAAFFSSLSIWIQMTSRHAHEVVLAFFFMLLTVLFLLKYLKNNKLQDIALSSLFYFLALMSYHIAKTFIIFLLPIILFHIFKNRRSLKMMHMAKVLVIFLIPIAIFISAEFANPANRIKNLIFFQDPGFTMSITEDIGEHPNRLLHNKLVYGVQYLLNHYVSYFSTEFLIVNGDDNAKFGYRGLSPVSVAEFLFFLLGLYYLFKNKELNRQILVFLLLVSPVSATLAWQEHSLTRSFFMITPILLIASYGFYKTIHEQKKPYIQKLIFLIFIGGFLVMSFFSWEFYFLHYLKRPHVTRSWQCGYQEMVDYVRENYDKFDTFYISREYGQPYIFLLYYLKYPPEKYQHQASLTKPDKYGYGQVGEFDKFKFSSAIDPAIKHTVLIATPPEFINNRYPFDLRKIKKIKVGTEEIFWIYENEE